MRRMRRILHVRHRWVRVVNEDWAYARCTGCGKERELTDELFTKTFGEKPPYLHTPGSP